MCVYGGEGTLGMANFWIHKIETFSYFPPPMYLAERPAMEDTSGSLADGACE